MMTNDYETLKEEPDEENNVTSNSSMEMKPRETEEQQLTEKINYNGKFI